MKPDTISIKLTEEEIEALLIATHRFTFLVTAGLITEGTEKIPEGTAKQLYSAETSMRISLRMMKDAKLQNFD